MFGSFLPSYGLVLQVLHIPNARYYDNIIFNKLNPAAFQEYVDLYVDWMLNSSVSKQFNAFLSGFDLVVSDSLLKYLFDYKELELLIRGSKVVQRCDVMCYDGIMDNSFQSIGPDVLMQHVVKL